MKNKLIIIIIVVSLILIGIGIYYTRGSNKFTSDKAITLIKKDNSSIKKVKKIKEDENLYYFVGYDKKDERIDYTVDKKTKEVNSYTYIGEVDLSDSITESTGK